MMRFPAVKRLLGVVLLSCGVAVATVTPAQATADSQSYNLPGGDRWEVNAWHCGAYATACDWKASTKLLGTNPSSAETIVNRAVLESHGIGGELTISKSPSATLSMKSSTMGVVTLENTNSWIADNHGQMRPSGATTHVSVRSCGSGRVNSNINVSEKCAYAGAF